MDKDDGPNICRKQVAATIPSAKLNVSQRQWNENIIQFHTKKHVRYANKKM